ncbi:hypothetical protein V3C99_018068 [Haemonchus contortus]
MTGKALTK